MARKQPPRPKTFRPRIEALEAREVPAYLLQILHGSDAEAGLPAIQDAPRFAAIIDAFDDTFANTLILSGGDNFLPGPFFNAGGDPALSPILGAASIGRADIEILNRIGVEASAVGNHEFDAGTRELANAFFPAGAWQGGQFPYLSANVNYANEPDLNGRLSAGGLEASTITGRIAPTAIITENGEKIGLIGLTTPEILTISSPGPNLQVTPASGQYDFAALAGVVNNSVDALRTQHPDLNKIILLSHLQQFQNEVTLAPMLRGVDIIIAAGSNTISADANDRIRTEDAGRTTVTYPVVATSTENTPILIVSTDGNYRYVGRMVVDFDASGVLTQTTPGVFMDPGVSGAYAADDQGVLDVTGEATVADAIAASTKATGVKQVTDAVAGVIAAKDGNLFGKTSVYLDGRRAVVRTQETSLGNLTADANLFAAQQVDPTVGISLKNGGGIRDSIGSVGLLGEFLPPAANPDAGKQAGDVSQLDIENSLRFNNGLSLVSVTGSELRRLLEHGFAASGPGQTQGRFPQIGGMTVEVDFTKPANLRVVTLIATDVNGNAVTVVRNGETVAAGAQFRMVTLGFLVGNLMTPGGDGYPFQILSNPNRTDLAPASNNTFTTPGSEQKALADYLAATFPIGGPVAFGAAEAPAGDDLRVRQVVTAANPTDALTLTPVATVAVPGGAEISAYDPATQQLFVTKNNGGVPSLDVIDLGDPTAPVVVTNIDLSAFGASISSVAVKNGLVAAAMISAPKTNPGRVVFLDTAGTVLGNVQVGAVPDMITFTPDGNRVLVAIEGEAAENLTPAVNNPEGGVSIITLNRTNLSASPVVFAGFSQFNGQKAALRAAGVRLLADPAVSVAMDLEAEYIAIAADGLTARVTLQEANAFGVLDLVTNTFTSIQPLGLKDYSLPGNEFDASDRDTPGSSNSPLPGNIRSWPVFGVYMPDAVASFTVGGQTYYVTANEGDARPNAADTADTDVARLNSLTLDPTLFPNAALLQDNDNLGRLNVLTAPGDSDTDGDGDLDRILSLGGRSFTIFDSAGNRVFDSGSDFERRIFGLNPTFFNANDGGTGTVDQRSDDKGPEPEGVVTGVVDGRTYAFVGLERTGGGVMVYDVTDPTAPRFVTYSRNDGDVSPEGLVFVSAADSPSGRPLLIVSNEVSGTVTVYDITTPPVLNEFVAGPSGYVEVLGDPNADLSAFTLVQVDGGGTITAATPVGTTNAAGLWSAPATVGTGTGTFLLVRGFTGTVGADLDTNNDGVFDVAAPWAALADGVAVNAGTAGARTYGTVILAAPLAAGASRIPNGTDTNTAADWFANDTSFPSFVGEAVNTPGTPNRLIVPQPITPAAPTSPSAPAPAITGATILNGFLVVNGPDGQPSAAVAVPPGAQVFFADLNGDGNGDVLMLFAGGFVLLDGATSQMLALASDLNFDGFAETLFFSPTTGALQTVIVGRTGQVITFS